MVGCCNRNCYPITIKDNSTFYYTAKGSSSNQCRGNNSISNTHGRYRKLMRREFDETLYHERNKTETIFSVIKRRFDSEIKSYNDTMKTKELLYRVLAYNCHGLIIEH